MSVLRLAYILAIIGGVLLVVFGGLSLLQSGFREFYFGWAFGGGSVIRIAAGVVALLGASNAGRVGWAVVLIITGAVGGGLGGLLVIIGGVLGLVHALGGR